MPHQIDGELVSVRAGPDVCECDDGSRSAHDGDRKPPHVRLREESERETLLTRLLLRQPGVGDCAKLGKDRLGVDDFERAVFRFDFPLHLAHPLALAAVERKIRQFHARLFADLQQRQPQLQIEMQMLSLHFVKNGPAGVRVAQLAELPDQLRLLLVRSHRIAHHDPASPLHSVHDERATALTEE